MRAPRLSILDPYILCEFAFSGLAIASVLLVVFTRSFFADAMGRVASGQLPAAVMFSVLGLHLFNSLQVLLPMSMFIGMLAVPWRMYRDSEIAVLATSGLGPRGLLKPAALFAIGVTVIATAVAFWLAPRATRTSHAVTEHARDPLVAKELASGRFVPLAGLCGLLFASSVSDGDTLLGKVFMEREHARASGASSIDLITAAGARLPGAHRARDATIVMRNGFWYHIDPGHRDWRIVRFKRAAVALPSRSGDRGDPENARTTRSLVGDPHHAAGAELQWRVAMSCMPLVLAMLALPMAHQAPGRSAVGRVLVAVCAYLVISNLFIVARTLIARGRLAPAWGMWWILLPVFAASAWFFARQYATRPYPHRA